MPLDDVSTGDPHVPAHNEERDAINLLQTQMAGKVTAPPNPKVGDMLRWDGDTWELSEIRFFEGVGSPEGVVAAPIGSRYRDTAGTNGAVEWVKRTGIATDNTGWFLLAGDTGWINIAGKVALRTSGVAHTAQLRRVGNVVDLYLDLSIPNNNASPWELFTLDLGFRPHVTRYGALQDNKEGAAVSTLVTSAGVVSLSTLVSGKRDRWNGSWTTSDPWPSDLTGA
jgi:hypothetical protein